MLKAMKDYIEKICIEEYGHLVLLRAFDVVDDTVAVSKYIIEVINLDSVEILSYWLLILFKFFFNIYFRFINFK